MQIQPITIAKMSAEITTWTIFCYGEKKGVTVWPDENDHYRYEQVYYGVEISKLVLK